MSCLNMQAGMQKKKGGRQKSQNPNTNSFIKSKYLPFFSSLEEMTALEQAHTMRSQNA